MPPGRVSVTTTGLRVESPGLLTTIVKVTSVEGAPELGSALLSTEMLAV